MSKIRQSLCIMDIYRVPSTSNIPKIMFFALGFIVVIPIILCQSIFGIRNSQTADFILMTGASENTVTVIRFLSTQSLVILVHTSRSKSPFWTETVC